MSESSLPCFKGPSTLSKLKDRFQLDKSEREAASFMSDRGDIYFYSKTKHESSFKSRKQKECFVRSISVHSKQNSLLRNVFMELRSYLMNFNF